MTAEMPGRPEARPFAARIAGAPISWGVCEVPGWGRQLSSQRVLAEMRSIGLSATEFGPPGFLSDDPRRRARQLAEHGLRAVGGFFPEVLHDPSHDPLPALDDYIDGCVASQAGVVVLAAHTGVDGYDERPLLDDVGWKTLLANVDRLADRAHGRDVELALHPHVGTMIQSGDEVERVIDGSSVGLCLDTGHLLAGGSDPVAVARRAPERIRHVHLKDAAGDSAARVAAGELPYADAVRAGLFRPLGDGDIDIAGLVQSLEAAAYDGWYVLEQDVMLDAEDPEEGPLDNVRRSLDFLLRAAR
jgi:inosose dehydratase